MREGVTIVSAATALVTALWLAPLCFSQTTSTGALTGVTTDASRAVIPGVEMTLTNEATREMRTAISGENGGYSLPLLAPGSYRLEAALTGFKTALRSGIRISVTETTRLDVQLEVGGVSEIVNVEAAPVMVQQESSALGRVTTESVISNLPLVTRNFTQILGLSPGITMDVVNASELGRGSGGMVTSRTSVNGSRSYDNNFQVDGIDANDFESGDSGTTGGTAVPNPDAIAEFKVQTAQADASFGRNAGANVNVITKSGTNEFHGSLFEFFRNEALNANDFFFNLAGQRKPVAKQNQYGGTFGGPIKQDKLLFFASYQGTRQINGAPGGNFNANCAATVYSPPLTDDRSAAALGALFAGQTGQNGGVAIRPDGSNINPIALRLLQARQSDGGYLFRTPQVIDRSQPFARQGFSAFSRPCSFREHQFVTNFDYLQTQKSKISGRVFYSRGNQTNSFPSPTTNVLGTPLDIFSDFWTMSLAHSYVFSSHVFNELRVGNFHGRQDREGTPPFKFSEIGVRPPVIPPIADSKGTLTITGSYSTSAGSSQDFPQQVFSLQDHLSYVQGSNNFRFGGGTTRFHTNFNHEWQNATLTFLSFPDFLLGLDGASNGSSFSNIFSSAYTPRPRLKNMRIWDGFAYVQDDMKVSPRLTLNLGFRYERLGHPTDDRHINMNFDPALANPNPPPEGTLQGFIFPSDWPEALPPGVIKFHNNLGLNGNGQNNWAPRLGFAWQVLPNSHRLVLRGGYGYYYTHVLGLAYVILGSQAFGAVTQSGTANVSSTFQNPFAPLPSGGATAGSSFLADATASFFSDRSYSPTTAQANQLTAMDYRPGITQQYSLNVQTELAKDFLLELGYVGARGTHLSRGVSLNQARLASPTNPIRGITTNTVANVRQRVPILGFQPVGLPLLDSNGASWYNSLQTSLTKRMSKGLQMLVSYTWSQNMDNNAAQTYRGSRGGGAPGDNTIKKQGYGRSELGRDHRFVVSYVYELPNLGNPDGWVGKVANRWSVSGTTAIQTGTPLSIFYTNGNNVTGITSDRAQMAPGCTHADLLTSGRIQDRLNKYFNTACLTTPPVIGSDGRATAFGNSGVGIVTGPGQHNFDMSVIKKIPLGSGESRRMEFRAEFLNLLNTPQFSAPETTFATSTFGQISKTSVNPRFIQLALKLYF